jgi:hypothetical protein
MTQLFASVLGVEMSYTHHGPGRRARQLVAVAALGCSLLTAAGCASSTSAKSHSSGSGTPAQSASPSDTNAAAEQQVLAAYTGYRQV